MRHNSDLVTVRCSDHGDRLASGLWNLFSACHGVDYDVGSVRVHRLVLDVFLSTPKLTRQVQSDDDGVLYSLLEFLYTGKVTVRRDKLGELLEVARASDFHMLVELLETMTDVGQTANELESASTVVDDASDSEFGGKPFHDGGDVAVNPDVASIKTPCAPVIRVVELRSFKATNFQLRCVQNPQTIDSRLHPVTVKTEVPTDFEGEVGKDDLDFELDEVNRERGHPSCSSSVTSAGSPRSDRGSQRQLQRKDGERKEVNFATGGAEDDDSQRWNLQVKKIKLEESSEEEEVEQQTTAEKRSSDVHQLKMKIFKCDICGHETSTSNMLQVHNRIHTGEKLHVCYICKVSFTHLSSLNRHLKRHTGERPHKCDFCGASFTNSFNLKRHLRQHTGERPFKCRICLISFPHAEAMKLHEKKHS